MPCNETVSVAGAITNPVPLVPKLTLKVLVGETPATEPTKKVLVPVAPL